MSPPMLYSCEEFGCWAAFTKHVYLRPGVKNMRDYLRVGY